MIRIQPEMTAYFFLGVLTISMVTCSMISVISCTVPGWGVVITAGFSSITSLPCFEF